MIDPAQLDGPASPLGAAAALGVGAAKAVFAAKDFFTTGAGIWGSAPTEENRSSVRQSIDAYSANQSAKWGAGYTLAEGVGQVAVGLLGAEAGGVASLGAIGRTAADTLAATASFEPHAQNFANLAAQVPGLNGPMTQMLASSPTDSDTVGYVKNALTSLGLSSAIVGTFMGSALMLKALKGGDATAISSASADLEKALGEHVASLNAPKPVEGEAPSTTPTAQTPSLEGPSSSASPSPGQEQPLQPLKNASAPEGGTPSPGEQQEPSSSASSPSLSPPSGATSTPPTFSLDEEQFSRFIESTSADQDAFLQHGGWDDAVAAGHAFASEDKIPWQIIGGASAGSEEGGQATTALDAFIARTSEAFKAPLDDLKGGAVQTDAMTQKAIDTRVKLWGEDRSTLVGEMQAAGERAGDLRADMMGSFTIAQKALQDTWTLAQRIKLGDFSDYGGDEDAAMAALQGHTITSMRLFGAAQSIRANVGRSFRGLRSEFQLSPEAIRAVASMDPKEMLAVLDSANGDPRALAELAKPNVWSRVVEGAQLFMVNNLISSPTTHAVIIGSNLFQTLGRPAMRMGGSLLNGSYSTVGKAASASYWYMGASVMDALHSAGQAWKVGDSIIAPHDVEAAMGLGGGGNTGSSGLGQAIAQAQFGPWNNVTDILRNVLTAFAKTSTIPSRFVGVQDELVKQVAYRSTVQSRAFVDGIGQGLGGPELEQFVKDKLYGAFDDYGRATDKSALQQAKISTFQNDLNPGTQGAKMQAFLQDNAPARVILPFLRTPVNLFRQSVQLTPGLNLLQSEYRQMINGSMGPSSQAQAIGQMGLGSLLMGALATVTHYGYITGDAPDSQKLKGEALQDGWKPNSIVFAHADGTRTYVPYDRWDPVMMPMAMAANIVSVLQADPVANQNKAEGMLQALGTVMVHQVTDKLYLQNFQKTLEALTDPERTLPKWLGSMAGNYVPYSSALHAYNGLTPGTGAPGGDPYLRQADGFIGAAMSRLPGFSRTFSPKRDWAGDPITVHPGLWSNVPGSQANDEVNRLATQQAGSVGAPSSKATGGVDLRGITMAGDQDPAAAGRDAYDYYQEKAGHPEGVDSLRSTITKLVGDPDYQALPDGAADTQGTKLSVMTGMIHKYREAASKMTSADGNVRQAEQEEQLRVSKSRGQAAAPNPTPTNALTGVLRNLGARVGLGGVAAPSPAQTGGQ